MNEINGSSNYYNTTLSGHGEGNIYSNVINGTVPVGGANLAVYGSGLRYGTNGRGMPYNNSTSASKFLGNVVDYAPLTNQIQVCDNITAANSPYTLIANATINGATCFNINAANATLDCNGYSINGSNITSTYGIYSNQFNTTIRNCNISTFYIGVYLDGANNSSIDNSNISSTFTSGLGIYTLGAKYNRITNTFSSAPAGKGIQISTGSDYATIINTTGNSGTNGGMWIYYSSFHNISNSQGTSTSSYGFRLEGSSNNTVTGVNGTSSTTSNAIGFYLALNSSNNTITNCIGTSVDGNGLRLTTGSIQNTFTNCVATSSSQPGILMGRQLGTSGNDTNYNLFTNLTASSGSSNGVILQSGSNNTFTNSTITSTTGVAFVISLSSTNNTIINSTLSAPINTSLLVDATSGNNLFYWNNFTNTSGLYVNDTNGSNFYNTTLAGQPAGNIWFNVMNGSVSITGTVLSPFSGLYYGATGSGYPYNNSTSQSKFSCNAASCGDYAPLIHPTPNITLSATSWSVQVGTSTTVNCTVDNSQTPIYLYRNNAQVNSSVAGGTISETQTLSIGTYNYTCNSTSSQNYSAAAEQSSNLIVTAVPAPPLPQPGANNGGGSVYSPPAAQPPTEPPAVEPQPPAQNVTLPMEPQSEQQTLESSTLAVKDAGAALEQALKDGKDVSNAAWIYSAAKDALANGNYAEAEKLAREAAQLASEAKDKGASSAAGTSEEIKKPSTSITPAQEGAFVGLGAIFAIGGLVAIVAAGIYFFLLKPQK
ncbi:MAG: right-handed parallel beta-helix repeat-containing protein [Candidatus Micrarchaeota archaeon]|nr:right-handed parallel beta-helix repeat-containing protein [Candidatus Micrarchaeota archaeon]